MKPHRFRRRTLLGGAVSGFFAYTLRHRGEGAWAAAPAGRAKRCVVLWMNGGPSQLDTVDPKPGTATGGELAAIATAVPGLSLCETLPQVARQMDKLSLLRCLTSSEGEHLRAQYYLHTGYPFVPGFPRPAVGAVVSHEAPSSELPRYVTIGSRGYGPAYLGADHAPFSIEEPDAALDLLRGIRRRTRRLRLLQDLGENFDAEHAGSLLERRRAMVARIENLVATPFVDALDLEREPPRVRQRYGDEPFARACLLARRLLEVGVPFVEIQHDGWDTHANNFANVRRLCQSIDRPWALLLQDLQASGMLDETIVVWMGEFGRTPRINPNAGRDHFPRVTPVVLGGGGLAAGRAVGQTNHTGTHIEGPSYRVADLLATLFTRLGIDPARQFTTAFDSPAAATDKGQVIGELV